MALRQDSRETLVALSVYGPRSAAVRRRISKLSQKFARHLQPVDSVRQLVDDSMGARSLTEELRADREG
ncbi:MAG: hypothetical protein ACRDIY_04575 [Chloroflexota bacterium]